MNMFQLKKRILLILELLVLASSTCWSEHPLLRTGTFQAISTLTTSTTNLTTYPATFSSIINTTSPLSWGLGLAGYDNYLTASFSFNTTVTILNTAAITVTVKPEDSTYLLSLRLTYIVTALAPSVTPHLELIRGCFKCLIISQNINVTQGFSPGSRSESFTQPSLLDLNSSNTSIQIQTRSFLYSFNFSNIYGQVNYLQINTTLLNESYTHEVTTKEYNNINYVCISTISWNKTNNRFGNGFAAFFETYNLEPVNKTGVVPYYATLDCPNLVFMGFSAFSNLMGSKRLLSVHPETYSQFSLSSSFDSNSDFKSAVLNIFYAGSLVCDPALSKFYVQSILNCDITCLTPFNANVSNNCVPCNTICFTCSQTNPDTCTSCIAATNRNGTSCDCSGPYFSNSSNRSTNCLLCSDYMIWCTMCQNNSICERCNDTKFLVNGACQCLNVTTQTYLVTGICLLYPGCVNATIVTNSIYCAKCNDSAKFRNVSSSNLTCVCIDGYNNRDNKQLCIPNCGDGTVNNEECDDANNSSGDGCSSTCKVEPGWYCFVNSETTGPSHCLLVSTGGITYLYAQRVVGTNTALLYFTFSPSNINFPPTAFQGAVTSNAPLSSITATYSSANSRITLSTVFTDHLEGNSYNFTFNFTSAQVYYADPISVQVVTKGVNQQLSLQSYGVLVKTMQYVLIGTAFLGLGLGVVCAGVGHKLMGLELLLPMQAGFFAEFGMNNPPPYVSTLKGLKYSLGYNQLVPYNYEKFAYSSSKFAKFDFQIEMALNLNVMAGLLLLGSLVLLILQLIYLYRHSCAAQEQRANPPPPQETKKNNKGKKEEKVVFEVKEEGHSGLALKSARQNRNMYVNNFYFSLSVMLSQQTLFCFIIQNSQFTVADFYLSEGINLMAGYLVLLLVCGNLIFMLFQLFEKKDRRIITFHETRVLRYPIFLIFSCLLLALIMAVTLTSPFAAYIAAVLSVLPLAGLLYFRPYRHEESRLNAFSAFVNLAFPLVAAATYLVNNVLVLSEMGWLLSVVVIIVWQFTTETVTIIRMVKKVSWKELSLFEMCLKKKKKRGDDGLLEKNRVEAEMSSMVKNSLKGEAAKIVDWQQKNRKDYESISNKPDNDDEAQISEHNEEEDELAQLKRRLKKEIMMKKAY